MDQNAEDQRIQAKLRADINKSSTLPSDEELTIAEVKRRHFRLMAVFSATAAIWALVYFAWGLDVGIPVGIIIGTPVVLWFLFTWKCPACNHFLGQSGWVPPFCQFCGTRLKAQEVRTMSIDQDVTAYSPRANSPFLLVFGIAACCACLFLCCGGIGYFFFESEAAAAQQRLEADPRFTAHVGQIRKIKYNFSGSMSSGGEVDMFDVEGTKWSGRITVKQDEEHTEILWVRFTLPSGEIVEIKRDDVPTEETNDLNVPNADKLHPREQPSE